MLVSGTRGHGRDEGGGAGHVAPGTHLTGFKADGRLADPAVRSADRAVGRGVWAGVGDQ